MLAEVAEADAERVVLRFEVEVRAGAGVEAVCDSTEGKGVSCIDVGSWRRGWSWLGCEPALLLRVWTMLTVFLLESN